jgi:RNA polymerase sigma-70 factor (ECF subfamily)
LTNELAIAPLNSPDEPKPDALQADGTAECSAWVAQYWDVVYKLSYRLTADRHEAEDLSQETFLRAIERRSSFKAGTNARAWLLRIATNVFLDRRRRRAVMKIAKLPDEMSVAHRANEAQPGQGLEARELHASVERAIAELPETQRVVFVLRSLEDLSFRQIAEAVGTTEETARWHMMQARRHLLAKLDGKL